MVRICPIDIVFNIIENNVLEEYRDYLTSRIETLKKNIEDENSKKIGTYNK